MNIKMGNEKDSSTDAEEKECEEEVWEYHEPHNITDLSFFILEKLRERDNAMYTYYTQSLKSSHIMKLIYKKYPQFKPQRVVIQKYESGSDENQIDDDD